MIDTHNRNVVVFLGAGASSFALLPTVTQFFKHVHWPGGAEGKGYNGASQDLARLISIYEGTQDHVQWPTYDAEKLLGYLEMLVHAEKVSGVAQRFRATASNVATVPAGDLFSFLRTEIVRIYGSREFAPSSVSHPPHQTLFAVLDKRIPKSSAIEIFTPNYDTLVEEFMRFQSFTHDAFSEPARLCTGFTDGRPGRWEPKLFSEKPKAGERLIHLLKLHGSATWKWDPRSGGVVDTGWGAATGDLDCVLHLGYKSFPETEPFKTLHARLKETLLRPTIIVAIGFRFGDAYIRETFDFALRSNRDLAVVCCLRRAPERDTALWRLMKDFPSQMELLLGTEGKPVSFGDDQFVSMLETVLHQLA